MSADHIEDQADEFDNSSKPTLLDQVMVDQDDVKRIAEKLINGDKFKAYGDHIVDFGTVIDDGVPCNVELINAFRKLLINDDIIGVLAEVRVLLKLEVEKVAQSIYDDQ